MGEELHDITEEVIDNVKEVFIDPNQVEDQAEEATEEEVKDIKEVVIQREVSANDVDDFFDIRSYEEKCNNLPLPPSDDFPTTLDIEIEDKILQLKFFNRIWLSDGTTVEETLEDVNTRFDAIKSKNSRVEDNQNGKKINVATEGNKEVKINETFKP